MQIHALRGELSARGVRDQPAMYDFGRAAPDPVTFTIKNTGGPTPNAPVVTLTGADVTWFRITTNYCTTQLGMGNSCRVLVRFDNPFDPSVSVGPKQVALVVSSSVLSGAVSASRSAHGPVDLDGEGGPFGVGRGPPGLHARRNRLPRRNPTPFDFSVPMVTITATPAAGSSFNMCQDARARARRAMLSLTKTPSACPPSSTCCPRNAGRSRGAFYRRPALPLRSRTRYPWTGHGGGQCRHQELRPA